MFTEVRKKGCRRLIVDGKPVDISEEVALDEDRSVRNMDAIVDRFVVEPEAREGHQGRHRRDAAGRRRAAAGPRRQRCRQGGSGAVLQRSVQPDAPSSSMATSSPSISCSTIPRAPAGPAAGSAWTSSRIRSCSFPIRKRSIRGGCFVQRGVQVQPGYLGRPDDVQPRRRPCVSRSTRRGRSCPKPCGNAILYGIDDERSRPSTPPDAKVKRDEWEGTRSAFGGIARRIERHYRRYRQRGEANSRMEEWLDKVMVERTCPDCNGARLRATRLLFTIAGKTIHDVGQLQLR